MIYTLTPNPVLDLEYRVERIRMGQIHRSQPARPDWGGKGFNVSRALKILGVESVAVGFTGGMTGRRLEEGLKSLGIATSLVWIEGETRTNISIVGGEDEYIKVNEPGPRVTVGDVERLLDKIAVLTRPGDHWVMSGSLAPGMMPDFYAQAIQVTRSAGGEVLLDTSGSALRLGCAAAPGLVKPNLEEAAEMTEAQANTAEEVAGLAQRIAALGPQRVVISLGSQGAVAVEQNEAWFAHPLKIKAANPVGAGDALVAGLAAAWENKGNLTDMLRLGTACGASAASQAGTGIGSREQIERLAKKVKIERVG